MAQDPNSKNYSGFIHIPSINLYVAREKTHFGKNWFESHEELQKNRKRMPTIPEFIEFLKHTKEHNKDIYNEITQVGDSWNGEWLDADFKMKDRMIYISSNHTYQDGVLVPRYSEVLQENTLIKETVFKISLDSYFDNFTEQQGLPLESVEPGDLYYWTPMSDSNSVATFCTGNATNNLDCSWYHWMSDSDVGVRAVYLGD